MQNWPRLAWPSWPNTDVTNDHLDIDTDQLMIDNDFRANNHLGTDTNQPTTDDDLRVIVDLPIIKDGKTPRSAEISDGLQRIVVDMSTEKANKVIDIANIIPPFLVPD